jgi:hypothetical protein
LGEAFRRNRQFIEAADVLRRAKAAADERDDETLFLQIERALEKVARRDDTD